MNRRALCFAVLIVSVFSLAGYQQAYATPSTIPSSNMLDVPYHSQPAGLGWCCVASVQMALHYISGDVVSQDTLAAEMKTDPKEGTLAGMMSKPFYARGYAVGGVHTTLETLKEWNWEGHVSIIAIWYDLTRQDGHCVVVVGYNVTGIFVKDPWPGDLRKFISNKLLSNLWTFYDRWALQIPYKSGIYTVTLSVKGLIAQSGIDVVMVDGVESCQIIRGQPRSFYFKVGTKHTISVNEYVSGPEGTRYYAADNTVTVEKRGTCVIEYVPQHRLVVETIAGVDEKWYLSAENITLGPYDEIVPVDKGTRHFFLGLIVDGVERETPSETLRMDQPYTVAVRYATQYHLDVVSDFGDPKGEGWYASSDVASYSVTTPQGLLIRHIFMSWTGDIASTEPQGTLTMTQPYTIRAEWREDYTQLVLVLVASLAALVLVILVAKQAKRTPS